MLVAFQLLHVIIAFPSLMHAFEPELNHVDVGKISINVVLFIAIPVANYLLINFDEAEKRSNEKEAKVHWQFVAYIFLIFLLLIARQPKF